LHSYKAAACDTLPVEVHRNDFDRHFGIVQARFNRSAAVFRAAAFVLESVIGDPEAWAVIRGPRDP
jgi:hypothetical protein